MSSFSVLVWTWSESRQQALRAYCSNRDILCLRACWAAVLTCVFLHIVQKILDRKSRTAVQKCHLFNSENSIQQSERASSSSQSECRDCNLSVFTAFPTIWTIEVFQTWLKKNSEPRNSDDLCQFADWMVWNKFANILISWLSYLYGCKINFLNWLLSLALKMDRLHRWSVPFGFWITRIISS